MPLLQVIHEDEALLVLDKPAGLLCVPGRGADKQDCLSERARQRWHDALVVHRLDMGTSGLVLMARGIEMQRALGHAFATQQVDKRYEAVGDGVVGAGGDGARGLWGAPIGAHWPRRPLPSKRNRAGEAPGGKAHCAAGTCWRTQASKWPTQV